MNSFKFKFNFLKFFYEFFSPSPHQNTLIFTKIYIFIFQSKTSSHHYPMTMKTSNTPYSLTNTPPNLKNPSLVSLSPKHFTAPKTLHTTVSARAHCAEQHSMFGVQTDRGYHSHCHGRRLLGMPPIAL